MEKVASPKLSEDDPRRTEECEQAILAQFQQNVGIKLMRLYDDAKAAGYSNSEIRLAIMRVVEAHLNEQLRG